MKDITIGQIMAFLWEAYQVIAIAILTGMLVGYAIDALL